MPFRVVGVEEALGRGPVDHLRELPSEVHGVLHAGAHALTALGRMHVGGVAGEQHPAAAVGDGLPRHVGEPGDPAGAAQPEVRPVHVAEPFAELVQAGVAGMVGVLFHDQDPNGLAIRGRTDAVLTAVAAAAHAQLRLLVHLDLGDHPAGRWIQPDEVDAGGLADEAAPSVAADEVCRPEPPIVGQLHVDTGFIRREAHDLALTEGRHPELGHPVREDRLEEALPEPQRVVVARGEVGDVEDGAAEPVRRVGLALREEAFGDAPLIEHLDRAGEETPGSRAVEILVGASLDDHDIDAGQRQLPRQHQPGRAASCDHHRVLGHPSWSARLRRLRQAPALALRFAWRHRSTIDLS